MLINKTKKQSDITERQQLATWETFVLSGVYMFTGTSRLFCVNKQVDVMKWTTDVMIRVIERSRQTK